MNLTSWIRLEFYVLQLRKHQVFEILSWGLLAFFKEWGSRSRGWGGNPFRVIIMHTTTVLHILLEHEAFIWRQRRCFMILSSLFLIVLDLFFSIFINSSCILTVISLLLPPGFNRNFFNIIIGVVLIYTIRVRDRYGYRGRFYCSFLLFTKR